MSFELHPRLFADTLPIGDAALSRLLLMNDARYPWVILVPRREAVREIYLLSAGDQQLLWQESAAVSQALMQACPGDKLNVAALGNMVPQLHLHHIVRRHDDPAWPAPVWGHSPAIPYSPDAARQRVSAIRAAMPVPLQAAPGG